MQKRVIYKSIDELLMRLANTSEAAKRRKDVKLYKEREELNIDETLLKIESMLFDDSSEGRME